LVNIGDNVGGIAKGDIIMTIRPDAQAFDEIRIRVVPRFKESELSGSEWRISAWVEFYRKGRLRHEATFRDIETACGFLYSELHRAIDQGKAYFASEDNICDQEGCANEATLRYSLKNRFCKDGHLTAADKRDIRQFCERHKQRGDCGLDDADTNYTILS
jgi:hypothetical protein